MKNLNSFVLESNDVKIQQNKQEVIKVPKNTVILAVYDGNGDEMEIWTPQDKDIMAEMLMRKFDYSEDAVKDADKVLKLEYGQTLECEKLVADKNSTQGYKITCIK